jgi:GDP-L-fucose synthase
MKILVTGSSGFLGVHLCQHLEQQGHELTRTNSGNCDLTQADSLQQFNGARYDQIYHLATWTQAGDFALRHPGEQWIINQQINTNVLTWWQSRQAQAKLICIGASCAYAPDRELAESNYLIGTPLDSLFTYAMTKRMLYVGLLALQKQFNLRYLCLVPATLYGPSYHTEDGRQRHFIFDLIHKIIRGKLYGDPVVLWGDGFQKRELLFVDDFVSIALRLATERDNELINVGENVEFPIRHFAQLICRKVGYDFEQIHFDTTRYVGATSKCLQTEKLRQIMPGVRFTSLAEGLDLTVDWYWRQITAASGEKPA